MLRITNKFERTSCLLSSTSRGRFKKEKAEAIQITARQSIGVHFLADSDCVQMRFFRAARLIRSLSREVYQITCTTHAATAIRYQLHPRH